MASRMLRHFLMTPWQITRAFPQSTLQAIEAATATAERQHGGEIRFAIEADLPLRALWRNLSPRNRALQVFGELGVWDTEHNNGILIYVLLADRDVEIVADRGFTGKITDAAWGEVCASMEQAFRKNEFERGVLEGIGAVSKLIAQHYPATDGNELSNTPAVL